MSTVAISYSSLGKAAGEASDVAKKLDRYADVIERSVYDKLNRYDGSWTDNLRTARSQASNKVGDLRDEADRYRSYSENLKELKSECESVDKAVKSKVSSLTASFKEAYDINNNVVVNTISYIFTSITNSTAGGRWLNSASDAFDAKKDYFHQSIEDWYDYGGGKQLIKGVLIATLELVVGVISVAIAISALLAGALTGWGIVVAIAGLVTGVISIINGVTNYINEVRGYAYTQSEDPATGKRKRDLDTLTDTIRTESDSKGWHIAANALDLVNTVCTAITLVDSLGKLGGNIIKWASDGKMTSVKNLFSKEGWNAICGKFDEIRLTFKGGDFGDFKRILKMVVSEVGNNLKGEYWNFDDVDGGLKTAKNIFKVPLDLLKDGFLKTFGHSLVLPALTMIPLEGDDATFSDLEGIASKGLKIFKFQKGDDGIHVSMDIQKPVLDKLGQISEIHVGIPELTIPEIRTPILRAA